MRLWSWPAGCAPGIDILAKILGRRICRLRKDGQMSSRTAFSSWFRPSVDSSLPKLPLKVEKSSAFTTRLHHRWFSKSPSLLILMQVVIRFSMTLKSYFCRTVLQKYKVEANLGYLESIFLRRGNSKKGFLVMGLPLTLKRFNKLNKMNNICFAGRSMLGMQFPGCDDFLRHRRSRNTSPSKMTQVGSNIRLLSLSLLHKLLYQPSFRDWTL